MQEKPTVCTFSISPQHQVASLYWFLCFSQQLGFKYCLAIYSKLSKNSFLYGQNTPSVIESYQVNSKRASKAYVEQTCRLQAKIDKVTFYAHFLGAVGSFLCWFPCCLVSLHIYLSRYGLAIFVMSDVTSCKIYRNVLSSEPQIS